MSDLSPYEKLGVTEDASFDEIQDAKKRLTQKYQNDTQVVETIEAAYDAIIMDRLKMRQEGKIKVPDQIRFPDKVVEPKFTFPSNNFPKMSNQNQGWLQNFIDTPSPKEIIISGFIFLGLAMITVFNQDAEMLPFLLTIGVGVNFYFIYRKERRFGRTVAITFLVFVLGIGLGSILSNFMISSDFSLSINKDQFVSVFTFCLFWLISNFIR